MHIRTICYRAFCHTCLEIASPSHRMTEEEADRDLIAHVDLEHPPQGSLAIFESGEEGKAATTSA